MTARIALVAAVPPSGEQGGAERFFNGLSEALAANDLQVTILKIASDESCYERIQESYLRFYDLDLSGFDGVISSKAPSYVVRHPNHVCYLQHTMRVFYDMFEREFPEPTLHLRQQRNTVQALDTAALRRLPAGKRLAIGWEVAGRLQQFNGLEAQVMHHPSTLAGLHQGAFRHIFLPGRLHRWKRVDLAIDAMRHVTTPVELVIAGSGEDEAALRARAASNPRIRFTGRVSDQELTDLYAESLVVLFLPQREDMGLVTLEAFGAHKPVITCRDSGEPARLVQDGESGFVCDPQPVAIAGAIDRLASEAGLAAAMGARGAQSIAEITWQRVGRVLAAALDRGTPHAH